MPIHKVSEEYIDVVVCKLYSKLSAERKSTAILIYINILLDILIDWIQQHHHQQQQQQQTEEIYI